MATYLLRQLLIGLVTLFGAATIIFFIIHLVPGDPVLVILQDHFDQNAYDTLRHALGLDQPLLVQYGQYVKHLLTGNLGNSFTNKQPILKTLANVLPYTVQLALAGLAVSALIGIPAGIVAAVYRNRWPDTLCMLAALAGVCAPIFWLGVLLVLVCSVYLGWLPAVGVGTGLTGTLLALVLPAVTVGARAAGILARMTRSALLNVLGQDYVRTARGKGVHPRKVLLRHALRNAGIPILTVMGLELGQLLGGAVVAEVVFARRGLGSLLVDAVRQRDYPLVQGTLLLFMVLVLVVNLTTDLLYGVVDPRLRTE